VLAGSSWTSGEFDPALRTLAERLKAREAFANLILPVEVNGTRRWWELSASPRTDERGVFMGFHGVGSDVTVQQESAARIAQLAKFDTLTGLPNRLHLTEGLEEAVAGMTRWQTRCTFLMIDLDRFKSVNDTLGHHIGDMLLAQVAERLRGVCTAIAFCGRLGGDEFAVIIPEAGDAAHVERFATAIIERLSQPYEVDHHTLFIGASVGSATGPRDGRDAEALIRSADLAVYRAKEDGGGKHFAYVPALLADAEVRRKMELALRGAIERGEMRLEYQPVVDAHKGELASFEALLRWNHPEFGEVPPSRFIRLAEEARLIGDLGLWVLRTACAEAASWPVPVGLSLNLSPEQLCDPAIVETLQAVLAETGLPPERLELEVTESIFMREGGDAVRRLEEIGALGVQLALDDFGTGYSSLGYLSRTRFRTIKIDRGFVTGAALGKPECIAIITAVVALARSLGMQTTAEGVETEKELDTVREIGCGRIQGYCFGRAMKTEDVRKLFQRHRHQAA
jgi:diguanylate cyclase (GGDEF)-like protein